MPIQDTTQLKEKIISIIRIKGPALPVHIARETGLSMLFASAFLSELLSEQKIKISSMKIGNSPIYYTPGQESKLENFSHHLKSKEKDAFILLKEKKFLVDKNQEPAIRVALRSIKDFAVPFQHQDEIYWRYFKVNPEEFKTGPTKIPLYPKKPALLITKTTKSISKEKPLDIFGKTQKKEIRKRRTPQTKNEKFFNKVKEYLAKENIEILYIENLTKNDLVLRVKSDGKEQLLIAYNKKRVTENDIIKAHKKASELNLSYLILSFGEPLKKLENLMKAIKGLSKIKKIN